MADPVDSVDPFERRRRGTALYLVRRDLVDHLPALLESWAAGDLPAPRPLLGGRGGIGLYDAGGTQPPARGVVFVVGVGQRVPSVATYKARMQEWLQDSAFWVDMNAYVSDWSQEVYGDVRSYAAPGAAPTARLSEPTC